MAELSLYFLGNNHVILRGDELSSFHSIKVQALLNYLAAANGPAHSREELMTLLWPGMPDRSARHNLRHTLYHLRKSIPELSGKDGAEELVPLVITNRDLVKINPAADMDTDTGRFEALINSTQTHDHADLFGCEYCRRQLQTAIAIYAGDFLSDFHLEDSAPFESWAQFERDSYRRKMLDALDTLTTMHKRQKDFAAARAYAERQLAIDKLYESAYRQLMQILALSGQRAEALALYNDYSRLLREELGMEPAARTTELYHKIQAGDLAFDAPAVQGVRGYELKDEIGKGAFGAIYLAQQPAVGREVAVKVIRRRYASDPDFIRRFEAEAQTVARLEHPYIVPLYDFWRDPDGAYLVMRYLRGGNLLAALEGGPWDTEPAMKMLDQIASALTAAHQHGVVHRDIKPANILFDENGNAYLADFGIAKRLAAEETQMTAAGAMMGTPDYSSPEQILGEEIGPQSDIYSLGAVLYETLTGERPFPDSSLASLLHKQLHEPVPGVSESRPDLPREVDGVIERATAKSPSERYASALEMAEAFRLAIAGARAKRPGFVPVGDLVVVNPYKGLRAFQEYDAADFFGRELLVEHLVDHLADSRFLAVVGPSGSGKSSVVKAGLIPALRQGALKDSEKWFVAEMVPGSHPLQELEQALLPVAVDPPPSLVEPMQKDKRGLLRTVRRILPGEEGARLLLVIDQFEELFTLVEAEEERAFFLDSLLAAIMAPQSPLQVVITLRADFYDRPLQVQPLGQWIKENTEVVLPMSADELAWAIEEPARRMGVVLERGLVPAIVADVAGEPGALPLLQYALTELFDERQEGYMTEEAYGDIGGVLGALGRRAEELYGALDEQGKEAARQLFLRLVTLGEGVEDTRRRVLRAELETIGEQLPRLSGTRSGMAAIVDAFGSARLLTYDRDPETREPTVEVAHEALLREWPRLRVWLDESRADIRLQRLLAAGAAEWLAAGKDPGFLLRGSRLDQFEDWVGQTALVLTPEERAFLTASLDARRAREAEEEARRQRELLTAQQLAETERVRAEEQAVAAASLRRRATILAGVLVLALVLAAAAFFFARQSNDNAQAAEMNAAQAQVNAQLAATSESDAVANFNLARTREAEAVAEAGARATAQAEALANAELAGAAALAEATAAAQARDQQVIAEQERERAEEEAIIARSRELAAAALSNLESDPELSILLALQSLDAWHTAEAESALHRAVVASPLRQTFNNETVGSVFLAASPDGRILYVSGPGGGNAWDTTAGELLYSHAAEGDDWINIADFNPDGSLLALPHEMYDENGEELPGEVTMVDAQTGEQLANFIAHDSLVQLTKFSPDGSLLATQGFDKTVKLWDVESILAEGTGQLVAQFCCSVDLSYGLSFSPEGEYMAIPIGEGEVAVWDIGSGETRLTIGTDIRSAVDYSPDGQYLVTAGNVGNVDVWDAASGERLARARSHSGNAITTVKFNLDGTQIVSASNDGSVSVWRFSEEGLEEVRKIPNQAGSVIGAAFSSNGQFLYTSSKSGSTRIWDISSAGSAELAAVKTHDIRSTGFQPTADGSQLLTVGNDGMLRLWDTQNWQELRAIQAHDGRIFNLDVSPDGQKIATASTDDVTPTVWDAATWQPLFTLEGHELQEERHFQRGVMDVRFSPNGQRLATGGTDGTVRIWDAADGTLLQTLDHGTGAWEPWVTKVRYSEDGRLLAAANVPGTIKIWDAANGQLLLTISNDPPTSYWALNFSPDGSRIAAGGAEHEIEMWGLPSDPWQAGDEEVEQLYRLPSDAGWISDVPFSPDGERIAVSGLTGLEEIRDAATGELLLGLQHPQAVDTVAFSADGKRLMTSGWDGIFRIWALDLDELVTLAQSRVTRALTDEECRQYLHVASCPAAVRTQ